MPFFSTFRFFWFSPTIVLLCALLFTIAPAALAKAAPSVLVTLGDKTLFAQNAQEVRPIASISKLLFAQWLWDHPHVVPDPCAVTITAQDHDRLLGTRSKLSEGFKASCADALAMALISSNNQITHALWRAVGKPELNHPYWNGISLHEPTGLHSGNKASAKSLSIIAMHMASHPHYRILNQMMQRSHWQSYECEKSDCLRFKHTYPDQAYSLFEVVKTGYTRAAGVSVVLAWNTEQGPASIVVLGAKNRAERDAFTTPWIAEIQRRTPRINRP